MNNLPPVSQAETGHVISVKDFRAGGYLQELNRRFLHPLGLALSVEVESDDSERFGAILDYRDDPEGIVYGVNDPNTQHDIGQFRRHQAKISQELEQKRTARARLLSQESGIEPIPE